jgi:hypothetical protein
LKLMPVSLAAIVMGALMLSNIGSAETPPPVNDVVVLVDVSGSIGGLGPDGRARDILADVKRSIGLLVDGLSDGSRVAVVPFAGQSEIFPTLPGGLDDPASRAPWVEIARASDRDLIKQYVTTLEARGQSTHVFPAVERSLSILRRWQQIDSSRQHTSYLYLYTDGLDNEPGRADWLGDAASRLTELRRQDLPFLFAAWLQSAGSPSVACPAAFNGGCNPNTLPTLGLDSFAVIDFGPVSESSLLSAGRSLALAELARGVPSSTQSPPPIRISLSLQGDAGSTFDATVEPNSVSFATATTIALRARSGQTPGQKTGFLVVKTDNAIWVGADRIPVRYEFKAGPATEPVFQLPTAPSIDFGTLSDGALRSERTLALVEVSPGLLPQGATPPPSPRVSLSIRHEDGNPFDADIEPESASLGSGIAVALRARAGQAPGAKSAILVVRVEHATLAGPFEIPIRYEFSPCTGPCDTAWLLVVLLIVVLWAAGVAENRFSRRYSVARR